MSLPNNNSKFISLLLVLVSLFVFVFFTKWYYQTLVATMAANEEKKIIHKEKIGKLAWLNRKSQELEKLIRLKELDDLKKMKGLKSRESSELEELYAFRKKNNLEGTGWDEIWKYLKKLSEDEIINEMYSFVEKYSENWIMKILSLSITPWVKNELGFNESKINISARVQNKKVMVDFLDFLIENPNYKFFLNSFRVPKKTSSAFNIQVPVTFIYKDIKKETTKK